MSDLEEQARTQAFSAACYFDAGDDQEFVDNFAKDLVNFALNERRFFAQELRQELEDNWLGGHDSYKNLLPDIITLMRALAGEKDETRD